MYKRQIYLRCSRKASVFSRRFLSAFSLGFFSDVFSQENFLYYDLRWAFAEMLILPDTAKHGTIDSRRGRLYGEGVFDYRRSGRIAKNACADCAEAD